jgi:hypothetical protein
VGKSTNLLECYKLNGKLTYMKITKGEIIKIGSAFLDIAEEYGENVNGAMADWRFNKDGERFARRFESIED